MSDVDVERLRSIKSFPSLVKYLRDELEWPIESDDFDELTFDYDPEELGLDAKTAVKVKEIKQLRPLTSNQPWGIFFINFEPKRLPVVVLRRILRSLVLKKRQSANKAQQAAWQLHDLLFISAYGESEHRDITLANFSDDSKAGDLPTLKVLGWDDEDTVLHLAHAHDVLKEKLHWPENPADLNNWRHTWSQAFTLKHREVIGTSKEMAERMAELATAIRKRVNAVLKFESEKGPLRKLMTAFREALIHDLSEDDFADMYAQTITYGLLSARVSRPAGLVAENVADMVPITNPFLRDLLSTFLTVGGRKGKIDFDELGINDVVQALRDADMEAVLRDFGDKNRQEDPVIHFYELFLKEYDPEKRMKRGVFYTPRPVVSFIVRSVDEILRTEFGLADGLADTTTWGEMVKRHPEIKIPNGAKPEDPFVQILDPACGTGTFLVEVIDTICWTMKTKWRKQGHLELEIPNLWNEYVSEHLLPRLYGFELMMAPYAIAHMKIGLKLFETGYSFRSHERARIYLTNSLEPPQDFSDRFEFDAPALAHEAQAVNAIKRHQCFTVVIGNPPYSGNSSNRGEWIEKLINDYRQVDGKPLGEVKVWLKDDYVKFVRFGEQTLQDTTVGVLGYITNNSFFDGLTFRGMRHHLLSNCTYGYFLNLHGNGNLKERAPNGSQDENVFDILQGVGITLIIKWGSMPPVPVAFSAHLFGTRDAKYRRLGAALATVDDFAKVNPRTPNYFVTKQNEEGRAEYEQFTPIPELFGIGGLGFQSHRDGFVVAFSADEVTERMQAFFDLKLSDNEVKERFGIDDYRRFAVGKYRREAKFEKSNIRRLQYRPFDYRNIYYARDIVQEWQIHFHGHLLKPNLGLNVMRQTKSPTWQHVMVSQTPTPAVFVEIKDGSSQFPLYCYSDFHDGLFAAKGRRIPNLSERIVDAWLGPMHVLPTGHPHGSKATERATPEDIFHYAYAAFHSPGYRSRYAEFLKIDFPRLPLTSSIELFRALARLGGELVALHLLESPKLEKYITKYVGKGDSEVAKGHPRFSGGTVLINPTKGFAGVPEDVWNFHIGGYQVCEKWLKDRRGRVLSDEDIAHYQKIVVALKETIRLMAEIDQVIEAHGGWPGAFLTGKPSQKGSPL